MTTIISILIRFEKKTKQKQNNSYPLKIEQNRTKHLQMQKADESIDYQNVDFRYLRWTTSALESMCCF